MDHPQSRPSTGSRCPWGGVWGLACTGRERGRGGSEPPTDKNTEGRLKSGRRDTWGPHRLLQLTCSELIIRFRQGDLELLLKPLLLML